MHSDDSWFKIQQLKEAVQVGFDSMEKDGPQLETDQEFEQFMDEAEKEALTTKKWTKSKLESLKNRLFDLKEQNNIDIIEPKSILNISKITLINDLTFSEAGKNFYFWWEADNNGKETLVLTYYDLNVKHAPDFHIEEPTDKQIVEVMKWFVE